MNNSTFERGDVVTYREPLERSGWQPRMTKGRILSLDTDNQVFIVRNMAGTTDRVSVFEVKKVIP